MTLDDWLAETRDRYRTQSLPAATWNSLHKLRMGAQRRVLGHVGRSIWSRGDWDVLVILDACRTDLYRDVHDEYDLPRGGRVWSNASCSIDWITANFTGHPRELEDVAYVTANPFADHDAEHAQSADLASNPHLAHFRPLYKTDWQHIGGVETVPPEWVTNHAIDAWRNREEHGFDRMVVHYMQPHEPFITRPEWSYQTPQDNAVLKNLVSDEYQAGTSPWRAMVNSGRVSVEEFWPVYQDNLRWVLNDVTERLLANLDADSVVLSADHGNGLGEWGEWHHPPGAITPAVRRVPWVEVAGVDEQTLDPVVDLAYEASSEGDAGVTDRLEALGYR